MFETPGVTISDLTVNPDRKGVVVNLPGVPLPYLLWRGPDLLETMRATPAVGVHLVALAGRVKVYLFTVTAFGNSLDPWQGAQIAADVPDGLPEGVDWQLEEVYLDARKPQLLYLPCGSFYGVEGRDLHTQLLMSENPEEMNIAAFPARYLEWFR